MGWPKIPTHRLPPHILILLIYKPVSTQLWFINGCNNQLCIYIFNQLMKFTDWFWCHIHYFSSTNQISELWSDQSIHFLYFCNHFQASSEHIFEQLWSCSSHVELPVTMKTKLVKAVVPTWASLCAWATFTSISSRSVVRSILMSRLRSLFISRFTAVSKSRLYSKNILQDNNSVD